MTTTETALTTEQARRVEALKDARLVLQVSQAFGSQPPEPGDLVAVARFILDGSDLYEGEEEDGVLTWDEAQAMADYATEASTYEGGGHADLTADDVVKGKAYMVLPGARNNGGGVAPTPLEGTVVTADEDGVDADGDAVVRDQDYFLRWVRPEFLIPAL